MEVGFTPVTEKIQFGFRKRDQDKLIQIRTCEERDWFISKRKIILPNDIDLLRIGIKFWFDHNNRNPKHLTIHITSHRREVGLFDKIKVTDKEQLFFPYHNPNLRKKVRRELGHELPVRMIMFSMEDQFDYIFSYQVLKYIGE